MFYLFENSIFDMAKAVRLELHYQSLAVLKKNKFFQLKVRSNIKT